MKKREGLYKVPEMVFSMKKKGVFKSMPMCLPGLPFINGWWQPVATQLGHGKTSRVLTILYEVEDMVKVAYLNMF